MANEAGSNECTPSTTSQWEWVKIRRRPQGPRQSAPKAASRWVAREPLTITVRYLGGSQAWIEVKARGRVSKHTGDRALIDVLEQLWEGTGSQRGT